MLKNEDRLRTSCALSEEGRVKKRRQQPKRHSAHRKTAAIQNACRRRDTGTSHSRGTVAGSGGYWIATGAARIFAHRTTITGSIGVISILFSIKEFLASHGITHSVIRRGEYSDLGSPYREPNEGDTDIISSYTNKLYSMFVQKVAQTRNIPEPKVTELAEGHIYSGQDALTLGLVDEIGGIPSAIEWMKTKLGVSSVQVVFGPKPKTPLLWKLLGSQTGISSPTSVPVLVEELAKSYLGQAQGRPQAMMEDVRGV